MKPEFRTVSNVHDALNKYYQKALLNPFFIIKGNDYLI